jgi:hypothetical protein
VEMEKSVKTLEQSRFVYVGKMRCVATGRPVAQDHAEGPTGISWISLGPLSPPRRDRWPVPIVDSSPCPAGCPGKFN